MLLVEWALGVGLSINSLLFHNMASFGELAKQETPAPTTEAPKAEEDKAVEVRYINILALIASRNSRHGRVFRG